MGHKAKFVVADFYTDGFKPGHCKPPTECSRIDEGHRISDMKEPEQKTIQAIDAGKRSTWPQYTKHLLQHAIL